MRKSPFIKENKYGNISSFNFNRKAFRDGIWNNITTKARGLFINTNTNKIVARSYNKFFNIEEREETRIDRLRTTLKFPVSAHVKYNGFLGMLGYDGESDNLIITSKSALDSEHAGWFKSILLKDRNENKLKEYLKENNCSMVFETLDPINDPHIIKYNEQQVILLDVIKNDLKFQKLEYPELVKVGEQFNFKVKELAYTFSTWYEFDKWINEIQEYNWKYNGEQIEGFVICDQNNFMAKIKLREYRQWKQLRNILEKVQKGDIVSVDRFNFGIERDFYSWLLENKDNLPTNIIEARDKFKEKYKIYQDTIDI